MGRSPLEVFKFAIYVSLPFGVMWTVADPTVLKRVLESTRYIVYPPEGERPPTGSIQEVKAHIEAKRAAKQAEAKARAEAALTPPSSSSASASSSGGGMLSWVGLGWLYGGK